MKLTLSHSDLSLALCEFLASRGMTAFDPNTVTAEFSFKRGSKELVCELDSEPKPPVAPAPAAAGAVVQASTVAPIETPASEVPEVLETQAPEQDPVEAPTQEPAGTQPVTDADNLFD
ncbi:MAG: hypothetical protein J6N20_09680 [Pseudomonas sp.]|nr:hypothetical protein [Pseudomonas sp.]